MDSSSDSSSYDSSDYGGFATAAWGGYYATDDETGGADVFRDDMTAGDIVRCVVDDFPCIVALMCVVSVAPQTATTKRVTVMPADRGVFGGFPSFSVQMRAGDTFDVSSFDSDVHLTATRSAGRPAARVGGALVRMGRGATHADRAAKREAYGDPCVAAMAELGRGGRQTRARFYAARPAPA